MSLELPDLLFFIVMTNTKGLNKGEKLPISENTPYLQDSKEAIYPQEKIGYGNKNYKEDAPKKGRLKLLELIEFIQNYKQVFIMLAVLAIFNITVSLISMCMEYICEYWKTTLLYYVPKVALALYGYAFSVVAHTVYMVFREPRLQDEMV